MGYSVTTGHGRNYRYGASVNLGPIAVSVDSETDHSIDANQNITFDGGTRYNQIRHRHTNLHEVWGSNAQLTQIPGPAIFYNY
jgi:hypothetical protein